MRKVSNSYYTNDSKLAILSEFIKESWSLKYNSYMRNDSMTGKVISRYRKESVTVKNNTHGKEMIHCS